MTIVKICYRGGMLKNKAIPSSLPWRLWEGDALLPVFGETIETEGLLDLGGKYGDPSLGDPVQYDELVITPSNGAEVLIKCYNRGIGLLFSSTPALRSIHRVICLLTIEKK